MCLPYGTMGSLLKPQQQGSSFRLSRVAFASQPLPSEATSHALLDSTSSGNSTHRPASQVNSRLARCSLYMLSHLLLPGRRCTVQG